MNYVKEVDELEVNHFIFTVRVEGTLDYDDGTVDIPNLNKPEGYTSWQVDAPRWSHDGYLRIDVWDYHETCSNGKECWVEVDGKLAELLYEAFCVKYDADTLAEEFAVEPDYDDDPSGW